MTMPTDAEIYERLQLVDDPELGLDIVSLGLVYGMDVADGEVRVTMTLTTQGCPMHDAMVPAVEAALAGLPGVEHVSVDLVWDPPWTPERLSPLAALALGRF
jgi:metal-sulfur cluster biosynthetic enzyme